MHAVSTPTVDLTTIARGLYGSGAPDAALWRALRRELRTDHAGETGAVMIYRGILAVSRDETVRHFARDHLATEQHHLDLIEAVVPPAGRSRLLPAWRLSGWLTGALPALFGARAVFATIEAVETFVDRHYAEQTALIDRIRQGAPAAADHQVEALTALRQTLETCRLDEVAHRDDAHRRRHGMSPPGPVLRLWAAVVGTGSAQAVKVCRWI